MLKDRKVETQIEDLSNSGIRFRCPEPIPLMSQVQIALQLPTGAKPRESTYLSITGVVVRSDPVAGAGSAPFETAIYFHEISDAVRLQIASFLQARLR